MIKGIFTFRREWVLLAVLIVLMVVMSWASPYFLDRDNLLDLSRHLAEVGIVACGMTLIIMTGGIDLSVGSLAALAGILLGYTWEKIGLPAAMGLAVVTGLMGGIFNGALVTRWKLPPLVVTLATMALYRGAAMRISDAKPVSNFPQWFEWLGQGSIGPLPVQLVIWIAVVIIALLIVEGTPVGRYTIAVGDNERAAHFAALPVARLKFAIYGVTGLLSGFAALIFTSRVSTARADAMPDMALEVITAVVLGGTAITGGRGTIVGTFLGVLILGLLRNGLSLADVKTVWREMLAGILLISTAILNQRMLERSTRRKAHSAPPPPSQPKLQEENKTGIAA